MSENMELVGPKAKGIVIRETKTGFAILVAAKGVGKTKSGNKLLCSSGGTNSWLSFQLGKEIVKFQVVAVAVLPKDKAKAKGKSEAASDDTDLD